MRFTECKTLFTDRIPLLSIRSIRTDRQTVYNHSCHEKILSPTNEMRFTDRKTPFTDRIPLLSIRSIRMDRQIVYNHSCHENISSPTNEMRFTDRKTLFTDRIPLLSIRSVSYWGYENDPHNWSTALLRERLRSRVDETNEPHEFLLHTLTTTVTKEQPTQKNKLDILPRGKRAEPSNELAWLKILVARYYVV